MENFEEMYKQKRDAIEERAARLTRLLQQAGRENDLFRAAQDAEYREKLYREFGI